MPPTRKRRAASESDEYLSDDGAGASAAASAAASTHQQHVKNLVRLALASEYTRSAIKRSDINAKVFSTTALNGQTQTQTQNPSTGAPGGGRRFKPVFDDAQLALKNVFGLELVELPRNERITVAQRRAALKNAPLSTTQNTSNASTNQPSTQTNAWILQSALPQSFRQSAYSIPPPRVPTSAHEAAYTGLCGFVVSLIVLSGGSIVEAKLERYLKRVNAETKTPVGSTEAVLARMVRQGYVARVREVQGGEEVVEYYLGPRGKVEVGEEGVKGVVGKVYGDVQGEEGEELERRIERSLKVSRANSGFAVGAGGGGAAADGTGSATAGRKKARKGRRRDGDDESEEEEGQQEESDED